MLIKNGTIHDAVHEAPYVADIAVENSKIKAIAPGLKPAKGEEVLDAAGKQVFPGMVDAHSHVGLDDFGLGNAGKDYNEKTSCVTPELRGIDSFYPQDQGVRLSLESGVTTVCTGPGSSNVLGGTFVTVKTCGTCVDDMAIRADAAMKCAFGENPKNSYSGKGCTVRMGIAAKLRETLFNAAAYLEAREGGKSPKPDLKMEALIPVLKGEMPLKAHAHRADDILTAIRIAKEFGVKLTLEHCTEGALIVDELVRAGVPVAIGPLLASYTKSELFNKTAATAGILADAGVPVCVIDDCPVVLPQYLGTSAGVCIRYGMKPFDALRAVTLNAARHIGEEARIGSLEVGKDADIVLADGDILQCTTRILTVLVDGKRVIG